MVDIFMPKAGFDMKEGRLIRWLKEVGDSVEQDEPIIEIETDKVTMEAESPASGILLAKLIEDGTTVPVLSTIGYIGQPGEKVPDPQIHSTQDAVKELSITDIPASPAVVSPSDDGMIAATPYARKLAKEAGVDLADISSSGQPLRGKDVEAAIASKKKISATPLARNYADLIGIDLKDVQGSGIRGKILKDDVLSAAQNRSLGNREPVRTPITTIRKAIANNMLSSLQTMAQTTISTEIDVTELMRLRKSLLSRADSLGTKITINDLLSFAAVKMVKENPIANASYTETELITYPYVNLSVAVATDYGLTSPVIHDADLMTLPELSKALRETVERARNRKLTLEDQRNPTMTLTNMGIFPVDAFTPILPAPQACIIGFGQCVEKPSVYQGQLCVRTMMTLSITYDHRILDGSDGGRIMKTMKEYLETPALIFAL